MIEKKRGRAVFALVLAALLLSGCAGTTAPESAATPEVTVAPAPEAAAPQEDVSVVLLQVPEAAAKGDYAKSVSVHTVDEFLAAIAPHTRILLQSGVYDLSSASDYGEWRDGYYTWEDGYDGYQLVIHDVEDLAILGVGAGDVTIAAEPRYANVLSFRNCANPLVAALTAGHTVEPGLCAGGVLDFNSCEGVCVLSCGLFGCGTHGVWAYGCRNVTVKDTEIYECSTGAVWATDCYDVRVEDCSVHDCGTKAEDYNAYALFQAASTTGFAVVNTEIVRNDAQILLDSSYSQEVYFLGCAVEDNRFTDYAFSINGAPPTVDGCGFSGNRINAWYPPDYRGYAVDPEGEELISFDLERMQRREATYKGPAPVEPVTVSGVTAEDGVTTEYHVSTVDEFLAAIGPDTLIYLDGERFDLSTASDYGGYGGRYYQWDARYDGPCLVIKDVSNLRIVGQGKDKTELVALPRYADVLRFVDCENIFIEGLTAGHAVEPGFCAGDVLGFDNVTNLFISDCGLYGCGVWGLSASRCWNLQLRDTEIYSCSSGALNMYECTNVTMSGMDIHDMPEGDDAYLFDCRNVYYEDHLLANGGHRL